MISRKALVPVLFSFAVVSATVAASAQTSVSLPDTSQTTVMDAEVSEQAKVTVPATVTFNVVDVTNATVAGAATVTASNIVLATNTKQLQISIQAAAASFTPPVTGATTWSASDLSWNAPTWTGSAAPAAGTLSNTAFANVATCDAGVATCGTTGLVFTLAAKSTVQVAGSHTLNVTWKFASIGT